MAGESAADRRIAGLDVRAVARGVAVNLVVAVPIGVIVRLLKHDDLTGLESNLWVLAALAILGGAMAGGWVAAGGQKEAPLTHAAAAAGATAILVSVFTIIRQAAAGDSVTVVPKLLLSCILTSLGVLAGFARFRRDVKEAAQAEAEAEAEDLADTERPQ